MNNFGQCLFGQFFPLFTLSDEIIIAENKKKLISTSRALVVFLLDDDKQTSIEKLL